MCKSRSLDLAAVRLGASIADKVHTKLALAVSKDYTRDLRGLDGRVCGASRDAVALGEDLEVVDERLHRLLLVSK